MVYRLILPDWAKTKDWDRKVLPPVIEGELELDEVLAWNAAGYNCYFLPNYPSAYDSSRSVEGSDIDTFRFCFVDLDLKDYHSDNKSRAHDYPDKEAFLATLLDFSLEPTMIVDSGNGIHAYWAVSDLDAMSFLRLQRRLGRRFHTDPAVAKLYQLMRVPGTANVKDVDNPKLCKTLHETQAQYTCEDLDKALPPVSDEDEAYCKTHYERTNGIAEKVDVKLELPAKWFKLAVKGSEAHALFYLPQKDRSQADWRIAHLMRAHEFTREEAMAVLMQTAKASTRAPTHRYNYAENIVSKIWLATEEPEQAAQLLSRSVREILSASADDETLKGMRFPCSDLIDATEHGFRLTHVMGLIGGAGAGKTAFGFNLFHWFSQLNPDYIHLAVTLEQPELEYAERWKRVSQGNTALIDSVHILGNYNSDGTYRNVGLQEIEDYVKLLEKTTGRKVGCVMIDHIGVLKKTTKDGEFQGLMNICSYMKAFAVNTNTFLIMQSQAPREKAGIGDIELDKDAAFGTSQFEWYCDYVVTTWQPLKRVYAEASHMTVCCFKFCKIRHKNVKRDRIQEDVRYALFFDPETERLRLMTADEKTAYSFFSSKATSARKRDKKTEPGAVSDIDWVAKPVTKDKVNGRDTTTRKD